LLPVSLDIYAESERSLHVTLCWNIINITKCLLPLEFVVWNCRPALQYYRMIKMVSIWVLLLILLFSFFCEKHTVMYNWGHTFELGVPIYTVVYLKYSVLYKWGHTQNILIKKKWFCFRMFNKLSRMSRMHSRVLIWASFLTW